MIRTYLNVFQDHILAQYGEPGKKQVIGEIRSEDEFQEFLVEHPTELVLCSSELDFPEEYTKNQTIIDLCYKIRS